MNKRRIDGVSEEMLVDYIRSHYTYDAQAGVVRKKNGEVLKGAVNSRGYVQTHVRIGGKIPNVKMYQIVWVLVHGRWPTQIDHINGDKTDNRIENLRIVDGSENNLNQLRKWKPNGKTGVPGVGVCKGGFQAWLFRKQCFFQDKYEAFFHSAMAGRMFVEDENMDEMKQREELEAGLRAAMQSLETKGQRVAMLRQLAENMVYMNRLQGVPLVVRLAFFRAFFAVFNYLRQRRQLGRREGELDVEVRLELEQILSKLLEENGVQ